jgi:hypothetical protein
MALKYHKILAHINVYIHFCFWDINLYKGTLCFGGKSVQNLRFVNYSAKVEFCKIDP